MFIGVDLDSVLAQIMEPLNRFHSDRYGTKLQVDDYFEFGLAKVWHCTPDEVLERIFEFYDSTYMAEIIPVSGAVEGINYLLSKHKLFLITSRPLTIETQTRSWIDRYFPHVFEQICLSNQVSRKGNKKRTKAEIGKELGIEALIDDHLEYFENCTECGIKSYLFDAPWNINKTTSVDITRIHGWADIVNHF